MKWTAKIDGDKVVIEGQGAEESGAIIEVQPSGLVYLYEIPQYGGFPIADDTYNSLIEAMKRAESWT